MVYSNTKVRLVFYFLLMSITARIRFGFEMAPAYYVHQITTHSLGSSVERYRLTLSLIQALCTNSGSLTITHNHYRSYSNLLIRRSVNSSLHYRLIACILLLLCGDIEMNPGPRPTHEPMYPCAVCQLGVNWSHQAKACDNCDVWVHKSCASMGSSTYGNIENCEWKCYRCSSINCSSFLLHAYNLNVSNSFEPLAGIPGDDSIYCSSIPSPRLPFNPPIFSTPVSKNISLRSTTQNSLNSTTDTSTGQCQSKTRNPVDNLRILVLNANSVKSKKPEISELCSSTQADVLLITETKLDNTVNSCEFLPQNFDGHIRKDRSIHGGGVMIALRNDLVADEVDIECLTSEIVCARINIMKSCPLYVVCYYRPPDDKESCDGLRAALQDLSLRTNKNPKSCIVVAGDFNTRDIMWETSSIKEHANSRAVCEQILATITENQLHQLQREPTRKDAILDLFCVNNPSLVKSLQTIPGISDHDGIIMADLSLKAHINQKQARFVPLWAKADWNILRQMTTTFCS